MVFCVMATKAHVDVYLVSMHGLSKLYLEIPHCQAHTVSEMLLRQPK